MNTKSYQELTFIDDYMFCMILENDAELCRRIIELLLGVEVKEIRYKHKQHEIMPTPERRSIKLDVYLNDEEGTIFDLEMQRGHRRELPKRSRYYQGLVDLDNLFSGSKSYLELPDSYIVFICTFDPFGRGKHKYEFRELCIDDTSIELGDGASKVFINALSKEEEMSDDMRAFLDYLCGGEPASELTRDIEERIIQAKTNREWEVNYMTFREYYAEEFEEAIEKERDKNSREIAARMLADGISINQTVSATKLPREIVESIACNLATE